MSAFNQTVKGNMFTKYFFYLSSITDVHTLIQNLMPATYFSVRHDISLYFGALKNNKSQTDHKNNKKNNWIYSRSNVWEKKKKLFIFSFTLVPFANIYIYCNHSPSRGNSTEMFWLPLCGAVMSKVWFDWPVEPVQITLHCRVFLTFDPTRSIKPWQNSS